MSQHLRMSEALVILSSGLNGGREAPPNQATDVASSSPTPENLMAFITRVFPICAGTILLLTSFTTARADLVQDYSARPLMDLHSVSTAGELTSTGTEPNATEREESTLEGFDFLTFVPVSPQFEVFSNPPDVSPRDLIISRRITESGGTHGPTDSHTYLMAFQDSTGRTEIWSAVFRADIESSARRFERRQRRRMRK